MAFIDQHTRSTRIVIPGPQALFPPLIAWFKRRRKRKEIISMLKHEDWLLQDMGLTRGDVLEALAKPGDASIHLRRIAANKRRNNRSRLGL